MAIAGVICVRQMHLADGENVLASSTYIEKNDHRILLGEKSVLLAPNELGVSSFVPELLRPTTPLHKAPTTIQNNIHYDLLTGSFG